ncbi:MAG TPA: hypothetical protein VNE41_01465, partial [Chitinophagaceae bacterium]|nr:hypothetical protein [Chitinophagaceae bacterium]
MAKFLSVDVSVMQVHRVTDTYGSFLEQDAELDPSPQEVMALKGEESLNAMTDGSMVLTREDGWGEV